LSETHQDENSPDLDFLDWPEVLACLAAQAQSARGQEACRQLSLAETRVAAEARLNEVGEALALLRAGESLPSLAFPEIEPHLDAVEKGVPLGAEELKQVAAQCETAAAVRRHFGRLLPEAVTSGPRAPCLAPIAAGLGTHEEIVFFARDTFDPTGELRDAASPELFRLRRERDQTAARVREQAEALMRSEAYAPYLQDQYVTLREDRFVLPLKASFKSMGLGIVHDTSRSGETVFVEPTRLVELNNRLKVIEIEIRRESRRILEELAALVAAAAPALRADREVLTRLDVVFAAARLALSYQGAAVELVDGPMVDLRALRHPLLALRAAAAGEPGAVVANDVVLGEVPAGDEARLLVVSGPNAGGKTVLLKAVGLAAVMSRAGLLVPAAEGSRLGFFRRVLADIGDQQSVTSDLSTFSAHLANVSRILQEIKAADGHHTLVLLDELMAGTHPEQGAALARASLEALAESNAVVITTTHYDSLKALTQGDPRFRNAGMEYDLERLRPTFRLRDGLPGRSYALDIAARMGLPAPVLERARALLGTATLGLEDVLRDLEEREAALMRAEAALEAARRELEERAGDQKAAAAQLAQRERDLALRSRDVIDAAVRQALEAIGQVVAQVKRSRSLAEAQAARQKLAETAREATAGLPERDTAELDVAKLREALANRALGIGPGKGRKGSDRQGRDALSGSPGARSARPDVRPGSTGAAQVALADQIPTALQGRTNSVDVRGLRADEALREVQSFLDRAVLEGADTIFVIHGHGTGALRRAIREYLATSPYVERFRAGGPPEGGDGVSVVSVRG
jgi:DNA mismatch repair protein MutS2